MCLLYWSPWTNRQWLLPAAPPGAYGRGRVEDTSEDRDRVTERSRTTVTKQLTAAGTRVGALVRRGVGQRPYIRRRRRKRRQQRRREGP